MSNEQGKKVDAFGCPQLVGTLSDASGVRDYAEVEPTRRAADIVEVRFDLISPSDLDAVFSACDRLESTGTRVLSTIRLKADGGGWDRGEEARYEAFRRTLDHSSWVDVEYGSSLAAKVCSAARARGKKALVSFHDFATSPTLEGLDSIYKSGLAAGADLVKFATFPTTVDHHVALVDFVGAHAKDGNVCAMGMGSFGLPLRIYLPTIGSALVYAYLDRPSAPGQLSCSHMLELLRLQIPRFNERYLSRTKSLEAA